MKTKKIRLTESELIALIEKTVKAKMGNNISSMGNMGMIGTGRVKQEMGETKLDPVGKEDADIDNDGDVDSSDKYLANRRKKISQEMGEDISNLQKVAGEKLTGQLTPHDEEDMADDGMGDDSNPDSPAHGMMGFGANESTKKVKTIVERLKRILKEKKGGNYCEDSPKGCIRKRAGGWVILDDNDPKLGVWRKCKSEKHCKSILAGYHASKR